MPEPIDADVDLHVPAQVRELRDHPVTVLAAIAAGGALGALARLGLGTLIPHGTGELPVATLLVNASGCLLIGVLMALIAGLWPDQVLLRPFLGVGVLGGYTTFSTYVVDATQLVQAHAARTALLYLALTVVSALVAVVLGSSLTRLALRGRTR